MAVKKKFDTKSRTRSNEKRKAVTFWVRESVKDKYDRIQKATGEELSSHIIELIENEIDSTDDVDEMLVPGA